MRGHNSRESLKCDVFSCAVSSHRCYYLRGARNAYAMRTFRSFNLFVSNTLCLMCNLQHKLQFVVFAVARTELSGVSHMLYVSRMSSSLLSL